MLRLLFIFFSFFLFFVGMTKRSNECFDYPQEIEKLNCRDIYDNSRWILFNWLGAKKLDDIYYGQMELRYKAIASENDTTVIFFNFYALTTNSTKKNKLELVANARVAFKQSTKKCIWTFLYPFEDFSDGLKLGDKRLELTPIDTTSKFLIARKKIINNCFIELAKQQHVID